MIITWHNSQHVPFLHAILILEVFLHLTCRLLHLDGMKTSIGQHVLKVEPRNGILFF